MFEFLLLLWLRLQRELPYTFNCVQSYHLMKTWFNILPYVSWLNLINPLYWFDLFKVYSLIKFNYCSFFKFNLIPLSQFDFGYSYLHLPVEDGEIISQYIFWRIWLVRPIPNKKYTGTIYPYIQCSGYYSKPSRSQPL